MLDRVYRVLLRLLPSSYDDDDRAEMLETYVQRVTAARSRTRSGVGVAFGEVLDLTGTLVVAWWPLPSFDSLRQDVRTALRSVRRAPLKRAQAVRAGRAFGRGFLCWMRYRTTSR